MTPQSIPCSKPDSSLIGSFLLEEWVRLSCFARQTHRPKLCPGTVNALVGSGAPYSTRDGTKSQILAFAVLPGSARQRAYPGCGGVFRNSGNWGGTLFHFSWYNTCWSDTSQCWKGLFGCGNDLFDPCREPEQLLHRPGRPHDGDPYGQSRADSEPFGTPPGSDIRLPA